MHHQPGDDIGIFLAVCEMGSFVAASKSIRLSASAVAKAIGRLEGRLGVRVFHRTTRSLSLTEEGRAYRDTCRSARREIERTETAIRNLSGEPAGTVRISLPPLFGAQVVAPALYDMSRIWPRLCYEMETSIRPSNLFEGEADLAIRIGELPDAATLVARHLGLQKIVLCGSSDYFSRHAKPQDVGDLADHDVIGTARGGRPAPLQFRSRDGTLLTWTPHTRLLLDGGLLALSAIRGGHGLGLLPRWLVQDDLDQGRLVAVLEEAIMGHLPVHAVWPASPILLPRLRMTIDAIITTVPPRLA